MKINVICTASSKHNPILKAGILYTDFSDHMPILMLVGKKKRKNKDKPLVIRKRLFSPEILQNISNELQGTNWECTVQITFIFIGQTCLVFGKCVCTCATKHSNAFRTFLNWLKNSKRVWHEPKLHISRLPLFANFDL